MYLIAIHIKNIRTKGTITTRKSDIMIQTIEARASKVEIIGFASPPVVLVDIALVATVPI
jgi:hypothetical protein